jgi:hypothetical protein
MSQKLIVLVALLGMPYNLKTIKKTVDGIWWKENFYNNANEFIKSQESSFNSTNLIESIAAGFTKSVVRSPRVKGASKVVIKITKVHYSDGSSCN